MKIIVEKIVQEVEDRRCRRKNVIIIGIPEQDQSMTREQNCNVEFTQLKDIFAQMKLKNSVGHFQFHRLGRLVPGNTRPRLIKVMFDNEETVRQLLLNSGALKKSDRFGNIIVTSDKTPRQMEQYRAVKEELNNRKNSGENNLKIKYIKGVPQIVPLN